MEDSPIVSVLLPVFNGEKYVAKSIASVQAQTLSDWELIVVDDGSTDSTFSIIADLASELRLRLVRQDNQGLSGARNRGLAEACGKYVAFLDADDLWLPNYLEKLLEALERRPDAELAFASWQYIDSAGELLPQIIHPFNSDSSEVERDLYWRNAILPSAAVARLQTVKELGGFDTKLSACEDWDLWLRLKTHGAFVAVPDVLMLYRAHDESMTDNVDNILRMRLQLNEKHWGPADGNPRQWAWQKQRAFAYTHFVGALGRLRSRDLAYSFDQLEHAIFIWPGLLDQQDTYYELACAYQQRGWQGTPNGLDLGRSASLIRSILPQKRRADYWSIAALALSQLAFISGNRPLSLRFALESFWNAEWVRKPRALRAAFRSVLPNALLVTFRGLRFSHSHS